MAAEQITVLPYSKVYIDSDPGDPITQDGLVEFRLLYEGELFASANKNSHASHKHAIRKLLHPQLRRQWQLHKGLRQFAVRHSMPRATTTQYVEQERVDDGLVELGKQRPLAMFQFVPMMTKEHALRCSLDILLLRAEEPQFIMQRGDLDGQVKTIFDALAMPLSIEQTGNSTPDPDETPFFCLMEDDRLISEMHVTGDQLLLLPGHRQVKPSDAFVVIHIRLNHSTPGPFDRYFD
jgi:hypothetical protein